MNAIEQLKKKQKLELESLRLGLKADEIFNKGKKKADLKLADALAKAKAVFDKSSTDAKTEHQKSLELLKVERSDRILRGPHEIQ